VEQLREKDRDREALFDYKYHLVQANKHDIIKQIKYDQTLKKVEELRLRKLVRDVLRLVKVAKVIAMSSTTYGASWAKKLAGFRVVLSSLRIQLHFRRMLRRRYRATQNGVILPPRIAGSIPTYKNISGFVNAYNGWVLSK